MSGHENNGNFIPKAESGTFCLDLANSQIDAESKQRTCEYSLLGTADDSAANISLLVKITKQISQEEAAESLPDFTLYGSPVNSVGIQVVKKIDSKLPVKKGTEPLELQKNEKEFLKCDSSSIIQNALSSDHSEIGGDHTQEEFIHTKTIYNQNIESNQGFKESVSNSRSENILLENEECKLLESGELPPDTTTDLEQAQGVEKSQDLEDGEVSCDDEDGPLKSENKDLPVCRFYIRNGCSWGSHCRFRHPGTNNKGNYVMFENKVLPVASTPFPPVWPPFMSPAYPINLNNMDSDPYYSQGQMEVPKRAPLLPTPSLGDILMTQMNYPKSVELDRSIPNPDTSLKSNPIVWQSRLCSGSPCSTTLQKSPSRTRSPSVSPPRYAKHVRQEIGSTDTSSLACKPFLKRYRLPSPPRSSVTRIRGPRTPSCSPPNRPYAKIRAEPKRQRLNTCLSSSTDSSESSSYKSTTESSEESSSSSESDRVHGIRSSRRIDNSLFKKQSSRTPAKSTLRTSARCKSGQIEWSSSRRQETSASRRTSRHTTKSKSRKDSPKPPKKVTRTPDRAPSRVTTKVPGKPRFKEDVSYPGRREYLLMKLMQVEEQIANKKKKMNLK